MSCLGNIIWIICGGFVSFLSWAFVGFLWSITIIGLPIGKQCFKFAILSLAPFGKDIENDVTTTSLFLNILWLIFGGVPLILSHLGIAAVLAITIVGIPFSIQHLKLARLAFMPFGAKIR